MKSVLISRNLSDTSVCN